jgi:hypothetical protein
MERQEKVKGAGRAIEPEAGPKRDEARLTDVKVAPGRVIADRATTPGEQPAAGIISSEQRHVLIAEAAYFRAESRGFEGGDPVEDWLAAEREVDQALGDAAG